MHTASHEARHAPTRCGQASSQGVRPVAEEIETNYRVVRLQFGRFVPSPEAPEAADQCVCVLGGLPYPLGQLSLFWNELAVCCIRAAMPRRPILSNALSRAVCPMSSPLFFWEQLGGLPRLWFGRFTIQGERL